MEKKNMKMIVRKEVKLGVVGITASICLCLMMGSCTAASILSDFGWKKHTSPIEVELKTTNKCDCEKES